MFQTAVRERARLIRRREGLQAVKKHRQRQDLGQSTRWAYRAFRPDHDWSYDFVHNQTIDGRRFRRLSMVDEFTRENPAIVFSRNMASDDVIRALDALIDKRGRPDCLRSDQGPQFMARVIRDRLAERASRQHALRRTGKSLAERLWPELQFDLSNDVPGSLCVRINL